MRKLHRLHHDFHRHFPRNVGSRTIYVYAVAQCFALRIMAKDFTPSALIGHLSESEIGSLNWK